MHGLVAIDKERRSGIPPSMFGCFVDGSSISEVLANDGVMLDSDLGPVAGLILPPEAAITLLSLNPPPRSQLIRLHVISRSRHSQGT